MRGTPLQIPRSVRKEGRRCAGGGDAPAALVGRQAVPPSPWRGAGERRPTCSPGREEPTLEQLDASEDGCDSMGKPVLEQPMPEGLEAAERTHTGAVCEGLQLMGGTPCWSRGRV